MLLPTLLLLSSLSVVSAGSSNFGESCSVSDNRLQAGTYQFYSDCDSVTYCASNGTCAHRGCRKDDFPFGYSQDSDDVPPKCSKDEFCPDEMDACQTKMIVGSACQMNRDGKLDNTVITLLEKFCMQINVKDHPTSRIYGIRLNAD